jgi:hypothetical protein
MASRLLESQDTGDEQDSRLGGQMSFLDHLDELRRRLVRSVIFVVVVFMACWFVSDYIYNFLARPVLAALADAQRRQLPLGGITGNEAALPLSSARENDTGRYVFADMTKLGASVIPVGTSVAARVVRDAQGQLGLFTDEPIYAGGTIIPKGVRLPFDLNAQPDVLPGLDDRLVVNTALEPFSLYVKVSLYTAVCLSVPFLLWQLWAFVAPGLYPPVRHPFIALLRRRRGLRLLHHLSPGGALPARARTGLSPAPQGQRLFRLHHLHHARHGTHLPDARRHLHPRAHRHRDGVAARAHLEDFARRHIRRGRRHLADERRAQHDAFRRADARPLHYLHLRRVDLRPPAHKNGGGLNLEAGA